MRTFRLLANALRTALRKLNVALANPPYNFMLHTAPFADRGVQHYHWHIEIMPTLTKVAGFEWGSGFYINPVPPENAAGFLRDVEVTTTTVDHEPASSRDLVAAGSRNQ